MQFLRVVILITTYIISHLLTTCSKLKFKPAAVDLSHRLIYSAVLSELAVQFGFVEEESPLCIILDLDILKKPREWHIFFDIHNSASCQFQTDS